MPDGLTPEERRAFQAGLRQAQTDAELAGHEKRLNAINGSIERNTRALESQNEKVDRIIVQLDRHAALEKERVTQVRDANEKQISSRQYWLGVATIVGVLLASILGAILGGIFH